MSAGAPAGAFASRASILGQAQRVGDRLGVQGSWAEYLAAVDASEGLFPVGHIYKALNKLSTLCQRPDSSYVPPQRAFAVLRDKASDMPALLARLKLVRITDTAATALMALAEFDTTDADAGDEAIMFQSDTREQRSAGPRAHVNVRVPALGQGQAHGGSGENRRTCEGQARWLGKQLVAWNLPPDAKWGAFLAQVQKEGKTQHVTTGRIIPALETLRSVCVRPTSDPIPPLRALAAIRDGVYQSKFTKGKVDALTTLAKYVTTKRCSDKDVACMHLTPAERLEAQQRVNKAVDEAKEDHVAVVAQFQDATSALQHRLDASETLAAAAQVHAARATSVTHRVANDLIDEGERLRRTNLELATMFFSEHGDHDITLGVCGWSREVPAGLYWLIVAGIELVILALSWVAEAASACPLGVVSAALTLVVVWMMIVADPTRFDVKRGQFVLAVLAACLTLLAVGLGVPSADACPRVRAWTAAYTTGAELWMAVCSVMDYLRLLARRRTAVQRVAQVGLALA